MNFYRQGLAATLTETALPYGYSLTVWATGEALRRHHAPSLADIVLFAVGAAAGYGLLRLGLGKVEEHRGGMGRDRFIRAGIVHALAIGAGVGVAAAIATAPAPPAWPLAAFASTLTYLGTVALEQAFEVRRSQRQQRSGDGGSR
jgi:hypothetical protein